MMFHISFIVAHIMQCLFWFDVLCLLPVWILLLLRSWYTLRVVLEADEYKTSFGPFRTAWVRSANQITRSDNKEIQNKNKRLQWLLDEGGPLTECNERKRPILIEKTLSSYSFKSVLYLCHIHFGGLALALRETVCYWFSATVRFECVMFGFRGNVIKYWQFIDKLQW